jgi:hypothetical protein
VVRVWEIILISFLGGSRPPERLCAPKGLEHCIMKEVYVIGQPGVRMEIPG